MKTLELKDLKYYLGTGLQWTLQGLRIFTMSGLSEETLHTEEGSVFNWRKHEDLPQALFPCFLPLSALTEPLPDGSIPIVELAKMALMYQTDFEVYGFEKQYIDGEFIVAESDMSMRFIFDGKSFWMQNGCGNINVVNNQLQLFEYLYQHHFWLGDQSLFETGEIIDKRSLK